MTTWNVFTNFNGTYAAGSHTFIMRFESNERFTNFEKWANKVMHDVLVDVSLYSDEEIRDIELQQSARLGGSPFIPSRFEIENKPLTSFDNNAHFLQSELLKNVFKKDILWEIDSFHKFYEKAMNTSLF